MVDGWMNGWMGGSKIWVNDCLQQLTKEIIEKCSNILNIK